MVLHHKAAIVAGCLALLVPLTAACGDKESRVKEPASSTPTGTPAKSVDDIPVAHTPPGGYGAEFPAPILTGCTEGLVADAPDLRGMWKAVAVAVNGEPAPPDHKAYAHFERVEQCGDRVVVTAGGVIHDMRADGSEANGVHDVAEFDFATPITVVATFEDGVHTLRPVGFPGLEVTRQLDGDEMVWSYADNFVARLRRIGGPEAAPPTG